MSMSVNFHSGGKPYLVEVGLYEHAGSKPGTGWLTIKTANGDDVVLHELNAPQMDMLGRAIRYAAAKMERQAAELQAIKAAPLPPQAEIEAEGDSWKDEMAEHGDPVG